MTTRTAASTMSHTLEDLSDSALTENNVELGEPTIIEAQDSVTESVYDFIIESYSL